MAGHFLLGSGGLLRVWFTAYPTLYSGVQLRHAVRSFVLNSQSSASRRESPTPSGKMKLVFCWWFLLRFQSHFINIGGGLGNMLEPLRK